MNAGGIVGAVVENAGNVSLGLPNASTGPSIGKPK
jgi:hypothetical protein